MNQFEEFEMPAKAPKPAASDVRARFPEMSKVIDDFKAAFGDDQVKVARVQEGDQVMQSPSYKPDSSYGGECTGDQFIRMGELSRKNSKYVNRDKDGKQ